MAYINAARKKGVNFNPVVIEGRTISRSFWGKAWCANLESYSDFANRLPRGRTYVRSGSVIDLQVSKGKIEAKVAGSSVYRVEIKIKPMAPEAWNTLVSICSGKIDSVIELLQGKFSRAVMEILTEKTNGLFPKPHEITMSCSCPDSAGMCKHIAATLYGLGARLDSEPQHLFLLRDVDPSTLVVSACTGAALGQQAPHALDESSLAAQFGIDIDPGKEKSLQGVVEKTEAIPKKQPKKKRIMVAATAWSNVKKSATKNGRKKLYRPRSKTRSDLVTICIEP
jgi:uncharacterized Zn finger protein